MSVSPVLDPALDPALGASATATAAARPDKRWDPRDVDWDAVKVKALVIARHPLFVPSVLAFIGLMLAFLPMVASLYDRWTSDEYYTHGFLVPFLSAFIVYRRWGKIQAYVGDRAMEAPRTSLLLKGVVVVGIVAWTWFFAGVALTVQGAATNAVPNLLVGIPIFGAIVITVAALYGAGIVLANRLVGFQVTSMAIMGALLPFIAVSYVGNIIMLQSMLFVTAALLCVTAVAGWRWAFALSPAVLFLLFGLPVWNWIIDGYTNGLQLLSTSVAYQILQMTGFSPYQPDPTTIYLNSFTLNVAIPCSGMKLLLALSAYTTLFVLVANLKFWSNVLMLGLIVPLCLIMNGLRIAMIGIVGNEYGAPAGMQFHDTSGYITLVVCFFLLFKIARTLGWKD